MQGVGCRGRACLAHGDHGPPHAIGTAWSPRNATQVLVRARLHAVRSKGKSAFLVLRQQLASVQAVLFVDDVTVSKGMVKYAAAIPKESIVDVGGIVVRPTAPVEGCSQAEVGEEPVRAGSGLIAPGLCRRPRCRRCRTASQTPNPLLSCRWKSRSPPFAS